MNWADHIPALTELHDACRKAEVNYSIAFEEGPNTFYVTIDSIYTRDGKPLGTVTKSYGHLSHALEVATKYIKETF